MQCAIPIKLSTFTYPWELVTVNKRFASITAPILWEKVDWQQVRRTLKRSKRLLRYELFIHDVMIGELLNTRTMEIKVQEIRSLCLNVESFRLSWRVLSNDDVVRINNLLGPNLKELRLAFEPNWEMIPINSQTIVQTLKDCPNLEVLSLNWVELDDGSLLSALENYPGHQHLKELTLVACPPGWQSPSLRLAGGQITVQGLGALYHACGSIVRLQASPEFTADVEILRKAIIPNLQRLVDFQIYTAKGDKERFTRQHNPLSRYANPWDIWRFNPIDIYHVVHQLPHLIKFRIFDRDYASSSITPVMDKDEWSRRIMCAWRDENCPEDLRNFAFVHLRVDGLC